MSNPITVDAEFAVHQEEDRSSRLSLIPWWYQQKIRAAKILAIGAGHES